ncbi:hypothetical protein [Kaarinaea lacus]
MKQFSFDSLGGIAVISGSLLFAFYSAMFPVLLPIQADTFDYVQVVLNPNWVRLALAALTGILLMLAGFYAVYARVRMSAGIVGAVGFLFIEAAYLLQACKVTWELFLYPIIASHPESAFLLRDAIIKHDSSVMIFRIASSGTILIGIILFCFTLYRSNEYPKAAPVLIFIGALVYAVGQMFSVFASIGGIFTLSLGCLLLGIRLIRSHYNVDLQPGNA